MPVTIISPKITEEYLTRKAIPIFSSENLEEKKGFAERFKTKKPELKFLLKDKETAELREGREEEIENYFINDKYKRKVGWLK